MPRHPIRWLLLLGALSCSAPFAEEEHSEGPPASAVRFLINVDYPVGSTPDPDGFLAIGPGFSLMTSAYGGEIYSPGLLGGSQVVVRVGSVGDWCTLAPTQRILTPPPGDTATAQFYVNCGTLYRATRVIYRQRGIRPDTVPITVTVAGLTVQMSPNDTLRRMVPVGRNTVPVQIHPGCRRMPSDSTILDVPYYPADTVNFIITTNCGVVRALATLPDGSPPQSLVELAGDSAYRVSIASPLPDAVRTRVRGNQIARARRRVTGGGPEWAISFGSTTPTEIQVRPWSSTFASFPTWRRDGSRIDYLVQDTAGITIWSAQPVSGGGTTQQLILPGTLALGSPDWSPDGTRLAYAVDSGIAIAAPGSVVADKVLLPTAALTLTDARWLPGVDSLVVVGALDTVGGARNAIWRMDISTGAMTQLTSPPVGETDGSVAVSDDGRHIAFFRRSIALGENDPAPRLRIRSLVDGAEWQLPGTGALQADPMWVP